MDEIEKINNILESRLKQFRQYYKRIDKNGKLCVYFNNLEECQSNFNQIIMFINKEQTDLHFLLSSLKFLMNSKTKEKLKDYEGEDGNFIGVFTLIQLNIEYVNELLELGVKDNNSIN